MSYIGNQGDNADAFPPDLARLVAMDAGQAASELIAMEADYLNNPVEGWSGDGVAILRAMESHGELTTAANILAAMTLIDAVAAADILTEIPAGANILAAMSSTDAAAAGLLLENLFRYPDTAAQFLKELDFSISANILSHFGNVGNVHENLYYTYFLPGIGENSDAAVILSKMERSYAARVLAAIDWGENNAATSKAFLDAMVPGFRIDGIPVDPSVAADILEVMSDPHGNNNADVAAAILDELSLDPAAAASILAAMSPRVAADILSDMNPSVAAAVASILDSLSVMVVGFPMPGGDTYDAPVIQSAAAGATNLASTSFGDDPLDLGDVVQIGPVASFADAVAVSAKELVFFRGSGNRISIETNNDGKVIGATIDTLEDFDKDFDESPISDSFMVIGYPKTNGTNYGSPVFQSAEDSTELVSASNSLPSSIDMGKLVLLGPVSTLADATVFSSEELVFFHKSGNRIACEVSKREIVRFVVDTLDRTETLQTHKQ